MMGEAKDFLAARAEAIKLDPYEFQEFPVIFWDLFGEQGHPIRATVSEMGPLLLSRLMNLSEAQEGIMNIAFQIADEEGLLLLDLKDLQALLANIAERADEISARYGNVTKPSVGAIQRALLVLEQQGGANFFGEPALKIADIMRTDARRARRDQRARRRQADDEPAPLLDLPALADVGTVRGASRGRRPGQAEAGLLLRRGASSVQRGAEGADRPGRAGRAADPLQGRRRLFRHAEPARRARDACWRSSATASSMRCAPIRRASRRR